jgi:cell division protein FtsQ
MREPTVTAKIQTQRGPSRAANRKLRQRRSWRLPSAGTIVRAVGRGLRAALPALVVVALLAGVSAGAVYGWRWVRTSPRFAVSDISITGNTRVTRDEILARAAIPAGKNIFTVDLGAIEHAVAEDPWIASVHVTRHLPHQVTIRVTERTAAAVVLIDSTAGQNPYLAGADGKLFKRAAMSETDGLVVISGIDRQTYTNDPDAAAAIVRDALGVMKSYAKSKIARPAIGEVHVDRTGMTLYTLAGAVALRLGTARGGELDDRLARLDVIWAALSPEERAAARVIHLDSVARPDRVTIGMAPL